MNGQAFNALKSATSALKNVHKELDVDKVQDIMDDLAEQHELENELAQLEQEALSKEMAQINLPTVPAHSVPAYAQPAGKAKNDQLAELERWAS